MLSYVAEISECLSCRRKKIFKIKKVKARLAWQSTGINWKKNVLARGFLLTLHKNVSRTHKSALRKTRGHAGTGTALKYTPEAAHLTFLFFKVLESAKKPSTPLSATNMDDNEPCAISNACAD